MRIVTLGSDRSHPLTLAALAVVAELEGVEHVDHLTANDERAHLRDPRSSEYQSYLAGLEPDLLLSAAYARIVPGEVLTIPKIGAINVHPSLLPDYRGVSAVWWALYEGRTRVGVTIHEMVASVDKGPILGQAALDVTLDSRPVAVWRQLGELVRPLLVETLEQIRTDGRVTGTPQPEGGCYRSQPHREAHRLEIDWSQTADELVRREGIFPGQGNIPVGRRRRIYARRVEAVGRTARPPGTILRRRPRSIEVAVGGESAVRLVFGRPGRTWIKFAALHVSSLRLRTLPRRHGTGTDRRGCIRVTASILRDGLLRGERLADRCLELA